MYAHVFDRRRLALPLLLPCAGGLYYLFAYDAPLRLVLINAGALAAVLAWLHRSVALAMLAAAGLALSVLTFGDGTLEPQVFTENVLAQVAERSLLQAVALAVLLFAVPLWQLVIDPPTQRTEGYALAALLVGLGVIAILAPFPYPLLGYGASPILGFGLALGVTVRSGQIRTAQFLEPLERTQ